MAETGCKNGDGTKRLQLGFMLQTEPRGVAMGL